MGSEMCIRDRNYRERECKKLPVVGIKIGLSAPLADRPYFGFCSSFEGTTKSVRCRYNGGILCIHCSDVCIYILVYYCCCIPCPPGRRVGHFYRFIVSCVSLYRLSNYRNFYPIIGKFSIRCINTSTRYLIPGTSIV